MKSPLKDLQQRYPRQLAFIRARLSPHGYFGLQMTLGALVLIAASWLFGGVSEDVLTGDPLTVVDQFLVDWFQAYAIPVVTQFMLVVSNLHGVVAISIYAVLFALYLLWKLAPILRRSTITSSSVTRPVVRRISSQRPPPKAVSAAANINSNAGAERRSQVPAGCRMNCCGIAAMES